MIRSGFRSTRTSQAAGEASLQSIGLNGAFVAMDVNSGEVLGLASNPTFDPEIFTRPLTQKQVDDLYDEDLGAPLFDRAIGGQYAVGSIFKPITALAGLDAGLITPSTVINDAGTINIADQDFDNAGKQPHGPVDLRRSLEVSSDVYYYLLGADMNGTRQLQNWAGSFGLGKATGIDIPGESEGLVPTPEVAERGSSGRTGVLRPLGDRPEHPVRDRPGLLPGQPAPDGGGLRGPRQRWHGAETAADAPDRGRGGQGGD